MVMDAHELRRLARSRLEPRRQLPTEAVSKIKTMPYEDAGGFAKVDLHRRVRCGYPEVIFGQGKTAEQIEAILRVMLRHGEGGLVTRVAPDAAEHLKQAFPEGEHNVLGRTFRVRSAHRSGAEAGAGRRRDGRHQRPAGRRRSQGDGRSLELRGLADRRRRRGRACIGCLNQLPAFHGADALVVVAGMEGALPSVVGGLVDCPVIAVPTSIGYGASFGGISASADHAQQLRLECGRREHRRRLQRRSRRGPDRAVPARHGKAQREPVRPEDFMDLERNRADSDPSQTPRRQPQRAVRLGPGDRGKSRHGRRRGALRSVGVAVGSGTRPRRLPGRSAADRRHRSNRPT